MYSCARRTRTARASCVREGVAGENFPGASMLGTAPRSAPMTSRRRQAGGGQARCLRPHFQKLAEADERIARQPLAPLDAFEQESGAKRCELQIRRNRRVEIGGDVKRRFHPRTHSTGNKKPTTTC